MERSEIERVLANWIAQATSAPGHLPEGVDPATWVARQFLNWWHPKIENVVNDAGRAVMDVRVELNRLGGWNNDNLGEALHGLIHASDALAELRESLGLGEGPNEGTAVAEVQMEPSPDSRNAP